MVYIEDEQSHVVCYGHASTGSATLAQLRARHKTRTKDETTKAYLASERLRELHLIEDLKRDLKAVGGSIRMVTLINKQDLWWHDRSKVLKHYMKGAYSRHIEALRHQHGSKNFTHVYAAGSLCQLNLASGDGSVLVPTASGYDASVREPHFNHCSPGDIRRDIELSHGEIREQH